MMFAPMRLADRKAAEQLSVAFCAKCDRLKHFSEFSPDGHRRNGLCAFCRACNADVARMRRLSPDYNAKHKAYRERNAERVLATARAARARNPASARLASKAWRARNPQAVSEYRAEYARRAETKEAARLHAARRRASPAGTLKNRIAVGMLRCLRGGKGGRRTEKLVGYSMDELRVHLERQFAKGMSWENMGEWHIDHIVPLVSFAITGPDDPELRRAWSLTNLRPLWASANLSKHDKRETLL